MTIAINTEVVCVRILFPEFTNRLRPMISWHGGPAVSAERSRTLIRVKKQHQDSETYQGRLLLNKQIKFKSNINLYI